MTRFLFRLLFSYVIIALLRAVGRRFGVVGILVLAVFVLLPLALIRFAPLLLR